MNPQSSASPEDLLLRILRLAPRRYQMPELPASLEAAGAAGSETVLAFAMEAARLAMRRGEAPGAALRDAFTHALADLIRRAMDGGEGDPVSQAQVLHARDAQVQDWVQLASSSSSDERSVRTALDAFAHPGKLRARAEGQLGSELAALHALGVAGDWQALAAKAASLDAKDEAQLQEGLHKLVASPALRRLQQAQALRSAEPVRLYLALRASRVPEAGSPAALDQGRASAREGELAERAAAMALGRVAAFLDTGGKAPHRVVRGLRTPRELMGEGAERAKEEWDAAILREAGEGTQALILLAEAKAAPAAATTDLPRLLRGLAQLSAIDAQAVQAFKSADGVLRLRGDSLRALRPEEGALPARVIYLSTAPAEARVALLGAAARSKLMAEAASLRFAAELQSGAMPSPADLATVWDALMRESRLRPALEQFDSARRAREAMLHPDDLVAAVDAIDGAGRAP